MPDLTINVRGGSKGEAELKKVANGYRAIGKEADKAANSSGKVGQNAGGPGTGSIVKAFFGKGAAKTFRTVGGLGAGLGAAYLAKVAASAIVGGITDSIQSGMEARAKALDDIRSIEEMIAKNQEKRESSALDNLRSMDAYDKARAISAGGLLATTLQIIDANDKAAEADAAATRPKDALMASFRARGAARTPNLTAAMEELAPMQKELQKKKNLADEEGPAFRGLRGFTRLITLRFDELHDSAANDYEIAKRQYDKYADQIITSSVAADRSLQGDIARGSAQNAADANSATYGSQGMVDAASRQLEAANAQLEAAKAARAASQHLSNTLTRQGASLPKD